MSRVFNQSEILPSKEKMPFASIRACVMPTYSRPYHPTADTTTGRKVSCLWMGVIQNGTMTVQVSSVPFAIGVTRNPGSDAVCVGAMCIGGVSQTSCNHAGDLEGPRTNATRGGHVRRNTARACPTHCRTGVGCAPPPVHMKDFRCVQQMLPFDGA